MGMEVELILLAGLILVFIASFCGLLQKIRHTYEAERILAEQNAREAANNNRGSNASFSMIYDNRAFSTISELSNSPVGSQIFPGAPPPYTVHHLDPPPKYEDVVKPVTTVTTPNAS